MAVGLYAEPITHAFEPIQQAIRGIGENKVRQMENERQMALREQNLRRDLATIQSNQAIAFTQAEANKQQRMLEEKARQQMYGINLRQVGVQERQVVADEERAAIQREGANRLQQENKRYKVGPEFYKATVSIKERNLPAFKRAENILSPYFDMELTRNEFMGLFGKAMETVYPLDALANYQLKLDELQGFPFESELIQKLSNEAKGFGLKPVIVIVKPKYLTEELLPGQVTPIINKKTNMPTIDWNSSPSRIVTLEEAEALKQKHEQGTDLEHQVYYKFYYDFEVPEVGAGVESETKAKIDTLYSTYPGLKKFPENKRQEIESKYLNGEDMEKILKETGVITVPEEPKKVLPSMSLEPFLKGGGTVVTEPIKWLGRGLSKSIEQSKLYSPYRY